MIQLLKCFLAVLIILFISYLYGSATIKILKFKNIGLPMKTLVGFFAYFILLQLVFMPGVYNHVSVSKMTVIVLLISILLLVLSCFIIAGKKGGIGKLLTEDYENECKIYRAFSKRNRILYDLTVLLSLALIIIGMFTHYGGWDTTFYIGELNEFVYYDSFWTHDAMNGGIEASEISLHYAISCFYPYFACVAKLFSIDARLVALYVIRSLCVIFAICGVIGGGKLLLKKSEDTLYLTLIFEIISLFASASHSSAGMMLVRGYESKAYCAAVICPLVFMLLVALIRTPKEGEGAIWRLLAVTSWASVPIAASSLAVVPVAIVIVSFVNMITEKRFWPIFWRMLLCITPNLLYMLMYIVRYHVYTFWG